MSFKRDGNDASLMSVLQKRRIKDLFAEDIPEDEAKLLSNGRFACLVCFHHPIFDTVAMLSIHRNGKKHEAYAKRKDEKKMELKLLMEKRRQGQSQKSASSSTHLASTSTSAGLLLTSPYDPRVRKYRVKRGGRKLQVNLQGEEDTHPSWCQVSQSNPEIEPATSTSSSQWLKVAEQQFNGPIKHDYRLKNIFHEEQDEDRIHITPYTSKFSSRRPSFSNRDKDMLNKNDGQFGGYQTPHAQELGDQSFATLPTHSNPCTSQRPHMSFQGPVANPSHLSNPLTIPTQPREFPKLTQTSSASNSEIKKEEKKKRKHPEIQHTSKENAPDKNPLAEKYYQLQGSGWKRDWDGKWIKDEQAEFDSDEEPPDLP